MTVEQAYALAYLAIQLAILYAFGATVFICVGIYLVVTGLAAVGGYFSGKSNCMLEAYAHYRQGAAMMFKKTRHSRGWRWPHCCWSYDNGQTWREFVPVERPRRWCPPLLFAGYERPWTPD